MSGITIRDVPDDVRQALLAEARLSGQSLQAYLLQVLEQQAKFSRNRQILAEVEAELAAGGGAGPDAPNAADVIARARAREDRPPDSYGHAEGGGAA